MILIILAIVLFNKYLYKSFLNPVFLQSLLWLIYYIFLTINIGFFNINISSVNGIILIQLVGFSVGGFLCYLFSKKIDVSERVKTDEMVIDKTYRNINYLYPVFLSILLFSLLSLIKQSGSFSIFNIINLRETLTEDDGKKFGTYGLIHIFLSVYLLLYYAVKKQSSFKFTIFLIIYFYFTLLLGSRGQFIFFLASLLFLLVWQSKIKTLYLLYFIVGFLLIMFAVTLLRADGAVEEDALSTILIVYLLASIPALKLAFTAASSKVFGFQTFRVFYLWINKLGFSIAISPVLSEYTSTPFYTNVYSYIKPYYCDFGYLGIFIIPLVIGFINNYIYFKANNGKLIAIVMMALLMFPMITQIFDEQYFR